MRTVSRVINGTTIHSKEYTDKELAKMDKSTREALLALRGLSKECIERRTRK